MGVRIQGSKHCTRSRRPLSLAHEQQQRGARRGAGLLVWRRISQQQSAARAGRGFAQQLARQGSVWGRAQRPAATAGGGRVRRAVRVGGHDARVVQVRVAQGEHLDFLIPWSCAGIRIE